MVFVCGWGMVFARLGVLVLGRTKRMGGANTAADVYSMQMLSVLEQFWQANGLGIMGYLHG